MLKQFSKEEILGKPLTDRQKRELQSLMEMRDEDIDTSDIPEVQELPQGAWRGAFGRGNVVHLTGVLYNYFSAIAARKGISLNELVNEVLRRELAVLEAIQ